MIPNKYHLSKVPSWIEPLCGLPLKRPQLQYQTPNKWFKTVGHRPILTAQVLEGAVPSPDSESESLEDNDHTYSMTQVKLIVNK